jgi:hypothetical protein
MIIALGTILLSGMIACQWAMLKAVWFDGPLHWFTILNHPSLNSLWALDELLWPLELVAAVVAGHLLWAHYVQPMWAVGWRKWWEEVALATLRDAQKEREAAAARVQRAAEYRASWYFAIGRVCSRA